MSLRSVMPAGALLFGAALAFGSAALPAFATDTNQPETWQTLPGESCEDVGYTTSNSAAHPYVLPEADDGRAWSKVIVKAGSTGHSVTDENTVYTGDLDAGASFVHAEKRSISHVIVCSVPSVTPADDPQSEDPETEDPETEDPESEDPETEDPETEDPETESPETEDPETEDPETEDPETDDPEGGPPQPAPLTRYGVSESVECAASSVTVVTTTHTTPYVFDDESNAWELGTEQAGEAVTTHREPTAAELTGSCGFVDTDPEASRCLDSNPRSPYTSWIRVDLDPRVIYRIDGVIVTAEFTRASSGVHVVTASAAPGYVLLPGAQTSWSYEVEDSAACQLETQALSGRVTITPTELDTLALTGTEAGLIGAIGITGVLAGLAGVLVAAGAHAERRRPAARRH